jgi:hypothetical protein
LGSMLSASSLKLPSWNLLSSPLNVR